MVAEKSTLYVQYGGKDRRVVDSQINEARSKLQSSSLRWREDHFNTLYSSFANDCSTIGVNFSPAQEEIDAAPESVRAMLNLLGLTSADNITIQLLLHHMSGHFEISFLPERVTDDHLGAIISSDPNYGGIVAPAYSGPCVEDTQIPHVRRFDQYDNTGYPTIEHTAELVIREFKRINKVLEGKFDGRLFDDGGSVRRTDEMLELLSGSVDWILALH